MRRILIISITMITVLLLAGHALTHTVRSVSATCPLCKHTFNYMADTSGTKFDQRLDLKPVGPIAAPWSIPVCPECGLVYVSKNDFSGVELQKCRSIIESAEYKQRHGRGSYVLLGVLYEGLGRDESSIAHVFLKASWQEEKDNQKWKEDMERSLGHFEAYLKTETDKNGQWQTAQILKGEILRRLGRFDEAKAHLTSLKTSEKFQTKQLAHVINFELELCEIKDLKPHTVSEIVKREKTAHSGAP